MQKSRTYPRVGGYPERVCSAREVGRGIRPERIVFALVSLRAVSLRWRRGCAIRSALLASWHCLRWCPTPTRWRIRLTPPANIGTPIFHSLTARSIRLIPFELARPQRQLVVLGLNLEWHSYPMDHTVSLEEIGDIRAWLRAR